MTRHMNMASSRGTAEVFNQPKKFNSKNTPSVPVENVPTGILISFEPTEKDHGQNPSESPSFSRNMETIVESEGRSGEAASVVDLNGSRRLEAVQERGDDNPQDQSNSDSMATQNDNQNATDSFKLCGYLDKLGEKGIIKTYKKRWFVFDNQRCMLCYYRSHEVVVPLGSIPIANATFSFNPSDSERPGNFSITVEGRVYQLQAKDYHTKMYWLQELQERRKSYSQLRTSLARDSTKRSSMEPTTGLVSTKRMKEKGGDPWSGLPPLLQPVTMPLHAVGEDTAGSAKPGISLSSIKMDLKNPIVGIKRWKSMHHESVPSNQTNSSVPSQAGADPCNVQAQSSPPIPKPRRKHLNADTSFMRPTSILQRFASNSSENSAEKCPKCAQLQAQLCSVQEELEMLDSEAKASQEVIQILHKQLTEGKIQQSTNVKFLECKTDQAKLTLMHRKDKQLVQLEQLLQEVKHDREAMKKELMAFQSKVGDLEEQISMFKEMLVAKDEIVMDLTMKIGDLEKAPPVTASSVEETSPQSPNSFTDQNFLGEKVDGFSVGQKLPPVANAFYLDRHEYEKLKDACQAFETQNKFLNKEILELNELRTQDQLRENTYTEKLDEFEAELYKLQSKHCLLLNELKAPRREVTSMEDTDDLVSQLIEEAIQSRGGDVENPVDDIPGRELYDKYGFTESLDDEDKEADEPLVTMAAEFQKKVDEIAMKHKSDENISHSVKWENFIISCRNRALVSTPELKSLVRSGIPHEHRARIWKECIERRVKRDMEECGPCYYEKLKTKNHNTSNPAVKQIELDLLRTLPNNRHYDKITSPGIPKLRNVLLAYSVHNPAIGYCQGLNRLAAIALLYLEEEDVFWCLVCVIEHIMPMDYYSKTLIGSQTDQKVLKDLLAEKLPRLNAHLDQHNIDLSLVTFNWFITVFCDNIPAETMLRIWDTFLFEGDKVLFRYALAFFKVAEEKLLTKKDYLSIFATLRQLPNMMKDVKKISQIAFHDLNPFPKKNIMAKREVHRKQVTQQLEELEAIRREFVPRHSQDDLIGSDDDDEEFETLEAPPDYP
ncbi:TBC1 domain family member 2B [Holothuria leucospilota]|uniref:TBC1 domain family member 2B n=1 Tax=Holothuria leucospilota TaxID=206669 RepID=A0A9Q1C430_HOLLE|nr:TBC1 domain family member 2B [Holothuria leucospilota]